MRSRQVGGAVVMCLALAVAATGCGASNSDKDNELRKELSAAAAKTATARSLSASTSFEVEEDGVGEEKGCVSFRIDNRKPKSFDLSYLDLNCLGGSDGVELIAVGDRAWASGGPGGWSEARIAPRLRKAVDDEQTDLQQLFTAAEGIESTPEGEGTEYADTTYEFKAPASAFRSSGEDIEDAEVSFEAVVDDHGYLSELTVHGDTEGNGVTVVDSFGEFGRDPGIRPPDPSEVSGPVTTIRSREDLEELIGTL